MHPSNRRPVPRTCVGVSSAVLFSSLALLGSSLPAGDGVRRYGTGTPGSGNIEPTIWVNQTPRPGTPGFKLRIERALGGTWAFPFVSQRSADFQYRGIRFLVDTTSTVYYGAYFLPGQGDGGGRGEVPLPLANNRELIGQPIYVQAFTLDDFAPNPLGFGATAGLRLEVELPGQLLVTRASPAQPDPQTAIDLDGGTAADFEPAQIDDGRGAAYVQAGTVALALDPVAGRLRTYDASTFPPRWTGNSALVGDGQPAAIATTPDGSRAYVLHTGDAGTSPPIVAYDVRAGTSFGRAWPGPSIRLEQVADPVGVVFTPDSATAFLVAAGPRSGGDASLTRIDVDPRSATFHQGSGELTFPGRQAGGVAIAVAGDVVYVALDAAAGAQIAVIDVASFQEIDMDPGAPGVQALGAEVSVPRTPLPSQLGPLLVDPRGGVLYAATLGALIRVDVAPNSPTFRNVSRIDDKVDPAEPVVALALADAGEALYAATASVVVEFDPLTGRATRDWVLTDVVDLVLR